ncbi:MAG TPA: alpha/beta hydrolase [Jatrophihabitans sp.]|uniref:alpha/beta fold hydrolase n=1 Tax=Jatrophihabitans sp. TaxID=1932789 RepID=UPI002E03801D|nr:alpha/beta hydrolase [Jatrophihabitans sp.]
MPRPPSRTAPTARLSDGALAPLDASVRMYPGRHVQIGSNRIHVRTTPAGSDSAEAAVFVHGLGGSAHNWTDFAGVLRDRLAVDSLDLPGHGRTGPAARNDYTLNAHADIVISYLEHKVDETGGPVHLAGNSMGGAISILVTARRPELVRTLTLISPAVPDLRLRLYPLKHDPRMAALAVPFLGMAALRKMAALPPEVRVKATIDVCFADPSRYPAERLRESVEELKVRNTMPWAGRGFLRSMRGLARWQMLGGRAGWNTLRSVSVPTLVVWGDTDRLVAPDLAPYVAAAIPGSRLLVLDHIGHTAMMEDPITTARAVLGLLDDVASLRS